MTWTSKHAALFLTALVIAAFGFDGLTTVLAMDSAHETNPMVRGMSIYQYLGFTLARAVLASILVWITIPSRPVLRQLPSTPIPVWPYRPSLDQLPWLALAALVSVKMGAALSNLHLYYRGSSLLPSWKYLTSPGSILPWILVLAGTAGFHRLLLHLLWREKINDG